MKPGNTSIDTSSSPRLTAGSIPAPRRTRPSEDPLPLGSLLQPSARPASACPACGGAALMELSMMLTDGTPVRFTSCRGCEHRRWEADGNELEFGDVLDRTRR